MPSSDMILIHESAPSRIWWWSTRSNLVPCKNTIWHACYWYNCSIFLTFVYRHMHYKLMVVNIDNNHFPFSYMETADLYINLFYGKSPKRTFDYCCAPMLRYPFLPLVLKTWKKSTCNTWCSDPMSEWRSLTMDFFFDLNKFPMCPIWRHNTIPK